MPMRAGHLRHRVIVQKPTPSQHAETNEETLTWSNVATVWGAVQPLRGSERTQAQQVSPGLTHKVTLRFRKGVWPDYRVLVPKQSTTLGAAISTTNGTSVTVSSALPFPGRDSGAKTIRVLVESELLTMTAGFGTTTLTVTRASDSTTAATHASGTVIHHMAPLGIGEIININERDETIELLCSEEV